MPSGETAPSPVTTTRFTISPSLPSVLGPIV
jgi:hypothetical protein